MAVTDTYQIVDKQSYLAGMSAINVWHYQQTSLGSGASQCVNLNNAFIAGILPTLVQTQLTLVTHDVLETINLTVPGDFENRPLLATSGTQTGEGMPPYVSWAFTLYRASRLSRNGYKRIVGVPESLVSNGVAIPAAASYLTAFAALLASPITDPVSGAVFKPVIYRKYATSTGGLPGTFDVAAGVYGGVSTQNTRKFGRGS